MASSLMRNCVLISRETLKRLRPTALSLQTFNDNFYREKRCAGNFNRQLKPFLREMYAKRLRVGPDKVRKRADWINWNYDCEIFSFGKRLGEEFDDAILRQAFVHRSYLEQEVQRRKDLGIDLDSLELGMEDNSELADRGEKILSRYVKAYLRNIYPYMFEECVSSIHDHLMSDETLSHISYNLGCEDLILSEEYPPLHPSMLSLTFKAVVGALENSQSLEQAEGFVRDFIFPQLIGKDINEMWHYHNPMGLLVALLSLTERGPPEPRLLWKSGSSTMMSLYWVGIYSNKQLLSKAPGETVAIAEEMAARDAIKKIMRTEDSRPPLILGNMSENLKLDYDRLNASAEDIIKRHFEHQADKTDKLQS